MVKYSFVLPAYKSQFFKEAINSILAQTFKDFELIIVNDASPEDIDSIIKVYSDSRIRYYVNEENIGGKNLVTQWNHCLKYAVGEYIILASDDDVYDLEYLEKMNILVEKYPNVNIFRPRVQYINEKGKVIFTEKKISEYLSCLQYIEAWVLTRIGSGIPFYIFKKAELLRIGGFVEYPLAWFSDDTTAFEMAENGIVYCDSTLFSFRCSDINISSKRHSKQNILDKIRATDIFYHYLKDKVGNISISSKAELELKHRITTILPYFICETKLRSQIFNCSLFVVISILPSLFRLNFFSKKLLIKYYISHFRSLLLGKY